MNNLTLIDLDNIILENKNTIDEFQKLNDNNYNYRLNIYSQFLSLFKNNRIYCEFIYLNNEYYIDKSFLLKLILKHPNKIDILIVLNNLFPNLTNVLYEISNYNDKKKYNYIKLIHNNQILNLLNIKYLYLFDEMLFQMIKSNTIEIIDIKYYKYLNKYIEFKIIYFDTNTTKINETLRDEVKILNQHVNVLLKENIQIKEKLNTIMFKLDCDKKKYKIKL
jgi:hypothetical protein